MAKKVVGELWVYSEIYDVDLPKKVLEELAEEQLRLDPEQAYEVDILFPCEELDAEEFYLFPISKTSPVSRGRKNLPEREIKREKMYDVLREQRDHVTEALKTAGINVWSSSIIGEEYLVCFVVIIFYIHEKEQNLGKKKSTECHMNSIMPSRKAFHENLIKALEILKEGQERQKREDDMEKAQKEQRTPNLVFAEALFLEIAQSMYPFDCEKALAHKEMLYKTAIQASDWPLHIKSRNNSDGAAPTIDENTKLDCPEYMMYTQHTTGGWNIEKIENLRAAQNNIVRHGYNLKETERIIILHNLKSVPYTLFKDSEEGLVKITLEEARGEKKLFLSWSYQ